MRNKLLEKITSEQLIEDFKQLGSAGKIAKKYGVNIATVYTAFNIISYDCMVRKNIDSFLTKEILEEAYDRLGSLKAVGREFEIAPDSVKQYMEKFGLGYKKQVRYNCDHEFFSRDNQESFYVAGFIAADGCVKKRKNTSGNYRYELQISLSKSDEVFLNSLKDVMLAETPIHNFLIKNSKRNPKWNDTECSQLTITSKQMFDDLARFNIVPRKSLIYTFPEWMKDHPLKHHFIRGYNDGDGSFFIPKTKSKYICFALRGTPEFLKEVRYILEKECDLPERDTEIRVSSGHGVLEYGGNGVVKKIADYLYKDATVYLDRKYQKAMITKGCV